MVLASGSLSHHFHDNKDAAAGIHKISREFINRCGCSCAQLWESGQWDIFTKMLPEYAETCHGEGGMHDTVMLLGYAGLG